VFPLCHCFPANAVENRKFIDVTCAFVPQTVALLKEKLGDTLRTALFSRLDPQTTLEAHTGWQDLANHVMRVHIPLVVPAGGLCGTWVDGCVETHQEGRPLCFDDAKVHRAFNYSKEERIVLILDLARPSYLPLGHATGGHTEELDSFINSLST
jgi:aspartyl/asparaginyl beta-hydroxylase (cupin superfamily)